MEEAVFESGLNTTLATQTANASAAASSALASMNGSGPVVFNSIYEEYNVSPETCTVSVESVNVVFTQGSGLSEVNLVISEGPSMEDVTSVTKETSEYSAVSHPDGPDGPWSGYGTYTTVESGPGGWWNEPTISLPSYECSYLTDFDNECDLSIWAGQTNEGNGGNGIAQAGADAELVCVFADGGCTAHYFGWYEFYDSSSPGTVTCFDVSPGNDISASSFYEGGTYYVSVDDMTTGESCGASKSSWMGAPNYGMLEAEQPVVNGVTLETPKFSFFTYQGVCIGGAPIYGCDLPAETPKVEWTGVAHLNLGSWSYDTNTSCVPDTTCWSDSWT